MLFFPPGLERVAYLARGSEELELAPALILIFPESLPHTPAWLSTYFPTYQDRRRGRKDWSSQPQLPERVKFSPFFPEGNKGS